MSPGVTERAKRLIAREIHSVEQLEVLLLLRAAPERTWTAADVARALVSSRDSVETRLADLEERGFIEPIGDGWRYAPSRDVADSVTDLAEAYGTHRVTVVGLIFSKPSDAVANLADAFRIRRRER